MTLIIFTFYCYVLTTICSQLFSINSNRMCFSFELNSFTSINSKHCGSIWLLSRSEAFVSGGGFPSQWIIPGPDLVVVDTTVQYQVLPLADAPSKMSWTSIEAHCNLKLFLPPSKPGKISNNIFITKEYGWYISTGIVDWLRMVVCLHWN